MKFIRRKRKFKQDSPIRQLVTSFLILIFGGAFLLKLPYSTVNGISFVNALFTSTSAVCVTGLTVLDTAKEFTFTGQLIILSLIQLGGFGIMTFSIGVFAMFSGDMSLKWRFTMGSIYSEVSVIPPAEILKKNTDIYVHNRICHSGNSVHGIYKTDAPSGRYLGICLSFSLSILQCRILNLQRQSYILPE